LTSYPELLERGVYGAVTAEQLRTLGRIQRSQRGLLSVINEVLNYARLETGAVTYQVTDVVGSPAQVTKTAPGVTIWRDRGLQDRGLRDRGPRTAGRGEAQQRAGRRAASGREHRSHGHRASGHRTVRKIGLE
jgi:hypothetical protein